MRLLVVESSHTMRKIIGFSLEKLPVQIVFAKDGDEAISLANQGIHLLLCSSRLGTEDGYGTAGLLKSKFPFIKTLMLLQKNEAYDAGRGLVFGITAVLEKPFFTQVLVEKVCELLSIPIPDQEEYAVFNRVIPLKQPGAKTKTPHQATASEIFSLTATPTPIPSSMAQSAPAVAPAFQAQPPKAEPITTKTMVGFVDANAFQLQQAVQEPISQPEIPPYIPSFHHLPPKKEVPNPQDQKTLIGFSSSDEFKAILESERQEQQKAAMHKAVVEQMVEQPFVPPIEYSLPPPPPPPVELEEDQPPPLSPMIQAAYPSHDESLNSASKDRPSSYQAFSYQAVAFEDPQSDVTPEDAYQGQSLSEPSTVFGYGYMPSIEDQKPTSEMPIINRDLLPTVAPPKYAPEAEEPPMGQAQQTPTLEAELAPPHPDGQSKHQALTFANTASLQDRQAEGKRITEAFQQVERDLPYEDEGAYTHEMSESGAESQSEASDGSSYEYDEQGIDEAYDLTQGQQEDLPPTQAQVAVNATIYGNAFLNQTHAKLSQETYQWLAQKLDLPEHHEELQAMLDKMIWEILPALAEATIKQELSKLLSPKP